MLASCTNIHAFWKQSWFKTLWADVFKFFWADDVFETSWADDFKTSWADDVFDVGSEYQIKLHEL